MSLPARGAWIETYTVKEYQKNLWSLPARGAWIETQSSGIFPIALTVAPRTGGVD
ncbi:Uncharacterized protein dnm_098600 [Desulfonema magnum]|uniref:Uncharacterized protein n=1 Tax=Desulfonema magnum TaxID=45655 RepID=A0A975BY41_9BACT|nr:Uncharacterized protein dnm_098600 [Desulfonema magnum]